MRFFSLLFGAHSLKNDTICNNTSLLQKSQFLDFIEVN